MKTFTIPLVDREENSKFNEYIKNNYIYFIEFIKIKDRDLAEKEDLKFTIMTEDNFIVSYIGNNIVFTHHFDVVELKKFVSNRKYEVLNMELPVNNTTTRKRVKI